jgi:RNA polymerase sigma factor (sigma-70 family)
MEAAVALAPAPRAIAIQSDADLVAAVRRGDDRAFEELYARYNRRISSYIFGMVKDHARAEDLTQDVFVSALRRMRDTDRPIAFKPWIYEIAKNACIDQFRRQRRAEEVSYDAEEGLGGADYGRLVTGDPTPDVALDHKQQLDHLRGALGGLSEAHHQILVMREFEGLSYREIGERMNMSRPSVESTLFRARKRLTEEYEDLVSGSRCTRVQAIISTALGGGLGARDRRRMARHLSYCQPCRRHARAAGLTDVLPERALGAKIAALLPLPAFLRRRLVGRADDGAVGAGLGHGGSLAQWTANLAPAADSAAGGWTKAIATAATVAVAGVGAGAMTTTSSTPHPLSPTAVTSLTASHHGTSKPTALTAGSVAGATSAVPPRSAAGQPTALRPGGKDSGSSTGAGATGAAGGNAGAPAKGGNQPGSDSADPIGTVTRGVLPSSDGSSGGSGGQTSGSTDDDPTAPARRGIQLPGAPSVNSPTGAGVPDTGAAVHAATGPVETDAKTAAPAASDVIDAAAAAIDTLTGAAQGAVTGASATLGQLGGG